ncbi:hypothetical protein CspeluHIS016_0703760 [Cutaneotrichosporon spelunceum]|uniref:RRM domain-containing protein n=1 Tax=Cutaneotrichosporon spelunceum TaxID=1672016 RepID=A0AAD3YDQ0_9TREE|nr:hypothetical protein CspeluHIS016_0703760 [Cutaneotrichosporon spelunceum]
MQAAAFDLHEIRIYGLSKSITTEALGEFLGKGVRVRGILLHPQTKGTFQWAQVWVASEAEIVSLLDLREALAVNGITISRVGAGPLTNPTPPLNSWDIVSQLSRPRVAPPGFGLAPIPSPLFGRGDDANNQPRNLYVLNLPLDLTQVEFKALFTSFGMVEHSILLSQLDGIGRRRGFVLMSAHREAITAMHQMNGKWIDGSKLDVSWALVQREAKNTVNSSLPNRVVHPPTVSNRRDPQPECTVLVENLDPFSFPDSETITAIFSRTFGSINRVIKISDMSALIQFDNSISAHALASANGLQLGERTLRTQVLNNGQVSGPNFDPFTDTFCNYWLDELINQSQANSGPNTGSPMPVTPPSQTASSRTAPSRTVRLSAKSRPFVPSTLKKKLDLAAGPPGSPTCKEGAAMAPSSAPSDSSSNMSRRSSVGTAFSDISVAT